MCAHARQERTCRPRARFRTASSSHSCHTGPSGMPFNRSGAPDDAAAASGRRARPHPAHALRTPLPAPAPASTTAEGGQTIAHHSERHGKHRAGGQRRWRPAESGLVRGAQSQTPAGPVGHPLVVRAGLFSLRRPSRHRCGPTAPAPCPPTTTFSAPPLMHRATPSSSSPASSSSSSAHRPPRMRYAPPLSPPLPRPCSSSLPQPTTYPGTALEEPRGPSFDRSRLPSTLPSHPTLTAPMLPHGHSHHHPHPPASPVQMVISL